jgi:antitoxin component YwqK of YwqJK toxin-antitoxin module
MNSVFKYGIKQTDIEIFKHVDDKDIKNLCIVNHSINSLLNEDKFWIQRFFHVYGKFLKNFDVKKYKNNQTWKEYYIDTRSYIKSDFPYYSSAQALMRNRQDILEVLQNFHKIKNVKNVVVKNDQEVEYYFTRDGSFNGIKEGKYFKVFQEVIKKMLVKNKELRNRPTVDIVSKAPDRLQSIFKNGELTKTSTYRKNIKIYEEVHTLEKKIYTTWSSKGTMLKQRIVTHNIEHHQEWFATGNRKCQKEYRDGKKNGIWKKWNKNGEEIVSYYTDGRKTLFIPTQEESILMEKFLASLENQIVQKSDEI